MAKEYFVKDVAHLYPLLKAVARLHPDEGDFDPEGRPPYQITPADIDAYIAINNTVKNTVNKLTLGAVDLNLRFNPFKIIELHRQLAYYAHLDGGENEDGNISEKVWDKEIHLPTYARGYHYWGKAWTPFQRLTTFMKFYREDIDKLIEKYSSSDFPMARSYVSGLAESPSNVYKLRNLFGSEKKVIKDLAEQVKTHHPEYANLIQKSMEVTKVLRGYTTERREPATIEPEAFGLAYLFQEDAAIYLIIYPQYGQSRIHQRRKCGEVRGKERCLPLMGKNDRATVLNEYLGPYARGAKLLDYKYHRIRFYLSKARITNYFRYDQKIEQEEFTDLLILHENLHFRNIEPPKETELSIGKLFPQLLGLEQSHKEMELSIEELLALLKRSQEGKLTSYTGRHKLGYSLVHLLRITLEARLTANQLLENRKKKLKSLGKLPGNDPIYNDLNSNLKFIISLQKLAQDAQEYAVDAEVWDVYYHGRKLKPSSWVEGKDSAKEKKLILNPQRTEDYEVGLKSGQLANCSTISNSSSVIASASEAISSKHPYYGGLLRPFGLAMTCGTYPIVRT